MDLKIELRHLRYFQVLADELHFGRAAQRLRIAQPALSQQIQQLERLLGVRLFERTSRTVVLTVAGLSFRPRVSELLERLSSDVDETLRVARGETGRIDIAFISSASARVGSMLRVLARQRPDVSVQLHDGFTDVVLDRVARGAADIGVVRDAEERAGLVLATILEEPFLAVVPTGHELSGARDVAADQLARWPLITFPQAAGHRAYARAMSPFVEAGIEPTIALRGSDWGVILQLVANGLGVTVAPASAVEGRPAGTVAIPIRSSAARSAVQLVHRARDGNPLVLAFAAIAAGVDGSEVSA